MDEIEKLVALARQRGYSDEEIKTKLAAAGHVWEPTSAADTDVSLRNLGRSAAQGLTFNFADEIVGKLPEWLGGGEKARDEMRQKDKAFKEAHPVIAGGAELAAGLALPGVGAWKALGTGLKTIRGAAGAGAALGGATAGASAAGAAEGGVGERLGAAVPSAIMGAGLGAAVPGGIAALRAAASPIARAKARLDMAVTRSGGTDKLLKTLDEFKAAGRGGDVMFSDLSVPLRQTTDFAANASEEAAEKIGAAAYGRHTDTSQRILGDVRGAIGDPRADQIIKDLGSSTRRWADGPTGYGGLRAANPAVISRDAPKIPGKIVVEDEMWKGKPAFKILRYLDDRGVELGEMRVYLDEFGQGRGQSIFIEKGAQRKGIGRALYAEAEKLGLDPLAHVGKTSGLTPAGRAFTDNLQKAKGLSDFLQSPKVKDAWEQAREVGLIGPMPQSKAMSFDVLQGTKERMDAAVDGAFNRGLGDLGGRLSAARDELVDWMKKLVPGYADVATEYHGRKTLERMVEAGQDAFRQADTRGLDDFVSGLNPGQLAKFREGAGSEMIAKLRSTKTNRDLAKSLVDASDADKDKLRVIFGSQKAAEEFMEKMRIEREMSKLLSALTGSQTAKRLAAQQGIDPLEIATDIAALPLAPWSSMSRLAGAMRRVTGSKVATGTARRLTPSLTTKGAPAIEALLQQLKKKPRLVGRGLGYAAPVGLGLGTGLLTED